MANVEEMILCQSCAMPMEQPEQFGTEADGSPSTDYCVHCYKEGNFIHPNVTLEEIIEFYAPQWGTWTGRPELTLEEAKAEINAKLSPLKRWKK